MVLAVGTSIQTGGNSFADSGGLKQAGPAPETEICYLNHKDARPRIVQLSPESQEGLKIKIMASTGARLKFGINI